MKDVSIYNIERIKLSKTPRPQQTELLDFTKQAIMSNKKFILIDAPVGIGKSYYSVMFMDWFKKEYDISASFDILTNSKILQEQYTNDFDFMNSLWGKGSYSCETFNTDCGSGMDWCKIQGVQCENCPYKEAKYKFENGDVALTNFHLFLTYKVFMPMAWKRQSRVLIIDEAHDFDSVFADFITTKISKPMLKRNGFTDDETHRAMALFGDYPEDILIEEFIKIIKEPFLNIAKSVMNRLSREAEEGSMEALNTIQSLGNHMLKWDSLSEQFEKTKDNWILEAERIKKYNKGGGVSDEYVEMTAQPVWAHPYLDEYVWSRYDYVIFMSGTILDKVAFSKMNGIDPSMADYICIDSPFPVANRPIYFFSNIGKQTFKTKEIVFPKQLEVLKKIMKRHAKEKGIIHTANYELQRWVSEAFDSNRMLAHDSSNRSEMLQQHQTIDEPTVLVSPSMMVGVDLSDDLSRHQTILKIPYPNLGSKKIKKRMDTMKEYYPLATVRDFIQSYGRSIRSMDDHASTYVLDGCFADLLRWNSHYFPKWVKEAVQYID
jgi:ATP-dependent DNA helicase DinG